MAYTAGLSPQGTGVCDHCGTIQPSTFTPLSELEGVGVLCFVPGFSSLSNLAAVNVPPISVPDVGTAYLAVCGPLSLDNQLVSAAVTACPSGATACLVTKDK